MTELFDLYRDMNKRMIEAQQAALRSGEAMLKAQSGMLKAGRAGVDLQKALAQAARENDEGMMVGAVTHEIAGRRSMLALLFGRQAMAKVERIGDAQAHHTLVEVAAGVDIDHVEAEVPKAADRDRPVDDNAANIELFFLSELHIVRHGMPPKAAPVSRAS